MLTKFWHLNLLRVLNYVTTRSKYLCYALLAHSFTHTWHNTVPRLEGQHQNAETLDWGTDNCAYLTKLCTPRIALQQEC